MPEERTDIRLALPSKGRLADGAMRFLAEAGFRVRKPNPRQYEAAIPSLPEVTVLFQRAGDIAVSVRDGSVDFGITGWDAVAERMGDNGEVLPLHKELGFGHCSLNVIAPENMAAVQTMGDLQKLDQERKPPLRVATKFPTLTGRFFAEHNIPGVKLIHAEGTLEVAPAIGYADLIVDLVSTGTTLRDNHLYMLKDGEILNSQGCLISNRRALKSRPEVLTVARTLLEFIVAHLRAAENLSMFANIRGESPEAIADLIFAQTNLGGLQGPTISRIISREEQSWFALHIIVRRSNLAQAITELRSIGGSGVVVTPVTYIFEEQPDAYIEMLRALED